MRLIISFSLSQQFGYTLDIDDTPEAVIVYPNSGAVLLHEGPDGIYDGVAIEGKAVLGFWIDRIEGQLALGIKFKRGTRIESHVFGRVGDQESAEVWIQRVNRVYEHLYSLKKNIAESRSGQFRNNPVIHDILATKEHHVLPGDYLRSKDGFPCPIYKPEWQKYYVERSLYHLQDQTGKSTHDVKQIWMTPPEHSYPYLSDIIKYTERDFADRISQPLEFMFMRGSRSEKIGIIPLAKAEFFASVFLSETPVQKAMNLIDGEQSHKKFGDWLEEFYNASGFGGSMFLLSTLKDTAVDYMMNAVILHGGKKLKGRKTCNPSISTLAEWLTKFQGIIACDVGIAYQIQHQVRNVASEGFRVGFSLVPYDEAVLVGEAYRVDDLQWGSICNLAIQDCFESQDEKVLKSIADTRKRVEGLSMKWCASA